MDLLSLCSMALELLVVGVKKGSPCCLIS